MPISVIFPKVSLEAASGRIARWCVAEGDVVAAGQVLFEIDNDKAAVEVEALGAGVIRRLADADVEVDCGCGGRPDSRHRRSGSRLNTDGPIGRSCEWH